MEWDRGRLSSLGALIALHVFLPPAFLSPINTSSSPGGGAPERKPIEVRRQRKREKGVMEGGKKQDAGAPANSSSSSTSSSSPSGFFSSVFPPPSTVMAKDSSQSDLYWTLSKQRADGSIGNAQGAPTDGKSQGSPTKRQTARGKDGKPVDPGQSEESAYFGSSVHYGGRDFYVTSPSNQLSGAPKSYKADEGDGSGDTNIANRGEWWQGSLYY